MQRTGSNRGGLWKGNLMTLAFNMLLLKHLLVDMLRGQVEAGQLLLAQKWWLKPWK